MKRKLLNKRTIYSIAILSMLSFLTACSKIEYTEMENPAYLRVFNTLHFFQDPSNNNAPYPMFTMLIDPSFDTEGKLKGARIVGDFLDQRDDYAPPYPSHIGNSTSLFNPEYPGKEKVMVGSIINGFDLSSWAQVPSGSQRVLFVYRPKTEVPFFKLEERLRNNILIDTVIQMTPGEVYTLNLLQKDFNRKTYGINLREEIFHKISLADSLSYVNFYNLSAKGYLEADFRAKDNISRVNWFGRGLRDTMAVHLSIMKDFIDQYNYSRSGAIPNYDRLFLGTVVRNPESTKVAPYYHFPTFPVSTDNDISNKLWQMLFFRHPSIDLDRIYQYQIKEPDGKFALMSLYKEGRTAPPHNGYNFISVLFPNMLINTHSGVHNPRTFSSVNTIEVVNGRVFLTTIQREYAPPIYRK